MLRSLTGQVSKVGSQRLALACGCRMSSQASTQLEEVVRRLDELEARVSAALQQSQAQRTSGAEPATSTPADQGWGKQPRKPLGKDASVAEHAADKAADVMEDAASDAVQKLHPALIKFLNSGYLVSQQQLRQRLMEIEWEDHLRLWAQRRGVAEFEQWLAKEGEKEGMAVDWKDVQSLYRDPEDLSPLDGNPRARLLAHSMIQQAMLDKQADTYRACTETAKQLANVIESGQRTGVSTLMGAFRKLLPLPFLR